MNYTYIIYTQKKIGISYSVISYTVIIYTGIMYAVITYTIFTELQNYRNAFRNQSLFCKNRVVIATS